VFLRNVVMRLTLAYSGIACADRAIELRDYGPCSDDDDCQPGASCTRTLFTNVCRPACNGDADCPEVDGFSPRCGAEDAPGQCVLPCEACPDGMTCALASPSPTSELICVWEAEAD
jgi:hypothetical protein